MRRFLSFLLFSIVVMSGYARAEVVIFDCPSRGEMRLDLAANTMEWGVFGKSNTSMESRGDSIVLTQPFGGRYFFSFNRNTGEVSFTLNGQEKSFDQCSVTTERVVSKPVPVFQVSDNILDNVYEFDCVRDAVNARDKGGDRIIFDFPNRVVRWAINEYGEITRDELYDIQVSNSLRKSGDIVANDQVIMTRVLAGFPSYFNLTTGEFFTNFDYGGRDLIKEFMDGRWSRGLTPQQCKLTAKEGAVTPENKALFAAEQGYNNLDETKKKSIGKYLSNASGFKDRDHPSFDPLATRKLRYKFGSDAQLTVDNLLIKHFLELSKAQIDGGAGITDLATAGQFFDSLVAKLESESEVAADTSKLSNFIDEKKIGEKCFETLAHLETAVYEIYSDWGVSSDTDPLSPLLWGYGVNPRELRRDSRSSRYSAANVRTTEEEKREYCLAEQGRVEKFAGRELIFENANRKNTYMVLETNDVEKSRLDGSWMTGGFFKEYSGRVTMTAFGAQPTLSSLNSTVAPVYSNLKSLLEMPFVTFVHRMNKESGESCDVFWAGYSRTAPLKYAVEPELRDHIAGYKVQYWRIPMHYYGVEDQPPVYFIVNEWDVGRDGGYTPPSKFYEPFEDELNFSAFVTANADNKFTSRGVVPLEIGGPVDRESHPLINSQVCQNALKKARNDLVSVLRKTTN